MSEPPKTVWRPFPVTLLPEPEPAPRVRSEVGRLIIQVLREAGRPLPTPELLERVREYRPFTNQSAVNICIKKHAKLHSQIIQRSPGGKNACRVNVWVSKDDS